MCLYVIFMFLYLYWLCLYVSWFVLMCLDVSSCFSLFVIYFSLVVLNVLNICCVCVACSLFVVIMFSVFVICLYGSWCFLICSNVFSLLFIYCSLFVSIVRELSWMFVICLECSLFVWFVFIVVVFDLFLCCYLCVVICLEVLVICP